MHINHNLPIHFFDICSPRVLVLSVCDCDIATSTCLFQVTHTIEGKVVNRTSTEFWKDFITEICLLNDHIYSHSKSE